LDNTSNITRSLDPYWIQNLSIDYRLSLPKEKSVRILAQINNLTNTKYEPNGYTFSYIFGGRTNTENFYFPMAGINAMIGLQLEL
jgi:iron complex outermembrane receptor protein